ncbi:MAG: NifU family protein [Campylobacterales bacterium]
MIPFSDEDLRPAVSNVIAKIEPMLALDGGSIKFIDVRNGIVFVQLLGACVGCASSGSTLKYGVERKLQELIHPEIRVVNVPFGMEERLDELVD